ncbi:ankyrin-1-like, partial [Olea europaea var. sylvestris]|uniref:ankyrin-1-like n=1 Tax=Olea europaea var. sylvestris TaxID=158386 RepID=UPI000C1CD21E
ILIDSVILSFSLSHSVSNLSDTSRRTLNQGVENWWDELITFVRNLIDRCFHRDVFHLTVVLFTLECLQLFKKFLHELYKSEFEEVEEKDPFSPKIPIKKQDEYIVGAFSYFKCIVGYQMNRYFQRKRNIDSVDEGASNNVDVDEGLSNDVEFDVTKLPTNPSLRIPILDYNANIRDEVRRAYMLNGSDPDITDSNGWTPLHFAAHEGSVEAVEFLLNHSFLAKYVLTKEGKTAFSLAVDKGNLHLYDMLHLGDMLHRAARIDDIHTMKSCLAQGGNVNGRDQYGWTPLHRAAFKGHIESVKLLVSHGARVDLVDGAGYTPLLRAVEAGHVQVAMHLLSHGAKANLKSLKGVVPSDLECFKKYNSLVNPLEQEERL